MRTPYRCALAEELAKYADRLDARAAQHTRTAWPEIKRRKRHLAIASRSLRSAAKAIEIDDSAPHRAEHKRRTANRQTLHNNVDNSVDN